MIELRSNFIAITDSETGAGVLILMEVVPFLRIHHHHCFARTTVEGNPNLLIGKSDQAGEADDEEYRREEKREVQGEGRNVESTNSFLEAARSTMVDAAVSFLSKIIPKSETK